MELKSNNELSSLLIMVTLFFLEFRPKVSKISVVSKAVKQQCIVYV